MQNLLKAALRLSIVGVIGIKCQILYTQGLHVKQESSKALNSFMDISDTLDLKARLLAAGHVIVQFNKLPSHVERMRMKSNGLELTDYIPHGSYKALVYNSINIKALEMHTIRGIRSLGATEKIAPSLKGHSSTKGQRLGTTRDVVVNYAKGAAAGTLKDKLRAMGIVLKRHEPALCLFVVDVKEVSLSVLAEMAEVCYIEPVAPPSVAGDLVTTTSHRALEVQRRAPLGLGLNGQGIVVGVGDAGYVAAHADLQNRVTNLKPLMQGWGAYGHEVHVSGIIGGNGNIDTDYIGMAPAVQLLTDQAESIIYEAEQHVQDYGMMLSNNSYWWNSYNAGQYNYLSRMADRQLRLYPHLQHVVISGNPGSQYGRVEGYFASAKNTLTVGSVDARNVISSTSGRGPCLDGRLKPEVVALGAGVGSTLREHTYGTYYGTSMACPSVTGAFALLYEYYQRLHDTLPDAGLVKAMVCNTAQDLGAKGPDYTYGYGKVNVQKAALAIQQGYFIQNTIQPDAVVKHSLVVPEGMSQLKILLYWKDQEASDVASMALVNDLDLSVADASTTYQPWVLDPSVPEAVAVRGKDSLNNIEQVTLDKPISGVYTITVDGRHITQGPQQYYIVYEWIKPGIELVYPQGGESLVPGTRCLVRWETQEGISPVYLEYSTDKGLSWNTLAGGLPATQTWYDWQVPDKATGAALIRARAGGYTSQSTTPFYILHPPYMHTANVQGSTLSLSWSAVDAAVGYEVFLLKKQDKEMQYVGYTTALSYSVPDIAFGDSLWVSVRAKSADGGMSKRAVAIRASLQAIAYITLTHPQDKAMFTAPATFTLAAAVAESVTKVEFYKGSSKLGEDRTPPYTFTWAGVPAGIYSIMAKALGEGGIVIGSEPIQVKVLADNKVPSVNLVAPTKGSSFTSLATITLVAEAEDSDGSIERVEFYNGNIKIGEALGKPYTYTWANIREGVYRIIAKAIDNAGASDTAQVLVTVAPTVADLLGPACGSNSTLLQYELIASKRTYASKYSWWYTGTAYSTRSVEGYEYRSEINTGWAFTPGQICVGVTYSTSPGYVIYCKDVSLCPQQARMGDDTDTSALQVAYLAGGLYEISAPQMSTWDLYSSTGHYLQGDKAFTSLLQVQLPPQYGVYLLRLGFMDGTETSLRLTQMP